MSFGGRLMLSVVLATIMGRAFSVATEGKKLTVTEHILFIVFMVGTIAVIITLVDWIIQRRRTKRMRPLKRVLKTLGAGSFKSNSKRYAVAIDGTRYIIAEEVPTTHPESHHKPPQLRLFSLHKRGSELFELSGVNIEKCNDAIHVGPSPDTAQTAVCQEDVERLTRELGSITPCQCK